MAKAFDIDTLAEGVETCQQQEIMLQQQCDYFQGFYLHKPANEFDLLKKLEQQSTSHQAFEEVS